MTSWRSVAVLLMRMCERDNPTVTPQGMRILVCLLIPVLSIGQSQRLPPTIAATPQCHAMTQNGGEPQIRKSALAFSKAPLTA
jgi:hypothetical protein